MFDTLEVFRMASGMARHASTRQDVVARNVANADTPGYRAQDIIPFAALYDNDAVQGLRATRAGHFGLDGADAMRQPFDVAGEASPNGNTVSIEAELMRSAEVRNQHDIATSIYKSSLDILRLSLGRR